MRVHSKRFVFVQKCRVKTVSNRSVSLRFFATRTFLFFFLEKSLWTGLNSRSRNSSVGDPKFSTWRRRTRWYYSNALHNCSFAYFHFSLSDETMKKKINIIIQCRLYCISWKHESWNNIEYAITVSTPFVYKTTAPVFVVSIVALHIIII